MKTKQQFFEWVGITPETFYSAHASYTETENKCRNESHEMLWALVRSTFTLIQNECGYMTQHFNAEIIESGTGKKWSEIIEFLESGE